MKGRVDLHMHTHYSDGVLSPTELVRRAKQAGLSIISITDHDNADGIDEAKQEGMALGVEVIPGMELSASVGDQDIHILGFFFDHQDQRLRDYLAIFRAERVRRAERIVGKLNDLKIPLTIEAVMDRAGTGSVGRPHIAAALVEGGLTGTYHEAFLKYIGFGKPAYEKKYQISPRDAVELISSAGGLSFVAHPGPSIDEKLLLDLIKAGVDGIEVVHPAHSPELMAYYNGITSEYYLLASGGSDFHGGRKNDHEVLGRYVVTEKHIDMMRRQLQ
jgi:predicted metal-dependent phosphoesterase TrpH